MKMIEPNLHKGSRGDYDWFTSGHELRNLGQACRGNVFESDLKPEQI
jgi:hypothetical protein